MKTKLAFTLSIIISCLCNSYAGNNPTIIVSSSTTKYLSLANKSASGVINDPTDPLYTIGIDFTIGDEDPGSVVITYSSNKTSVVPNNSPFNFNVSGSGSTRNIKIKPAGVGYATITITVTDNESKTSSYILKYAASAAASTPADNHFYTHLSSGSSAIAIDNDYMFVGDDEIDEISLYNRNQSGMPIYKFDAGASLDLDDAEVDIEASCKSPPLSNRMYWMGSMSNSKSGNLKPDRDRIFAVDKSGTGLATTLSFIGYTTLRSQLISWGNTRGYNFTASTAESIIPKRIDGFSIEGLEFAPNNTTLYIGFRTPFVPTTNRTKALICPVLNFETWFNNGSPSGSPSLGNPIELDLGGRGIRSISKNSSNDYIIVAGAFDGIDNFAVYKWTGNTADAPVRWNVSLTDLSPEGIVEVPATINNGTKIELLNDFGSADWYNENKESKALTTFEFQKFSTTWVTLNNAITSIIFDRSESFEQYILKTYPNPVSDIVSLEYNSDIHESIVLQIRDAKGIVVYSSNYKMNQGTNQIKVDCQEFPNGTYLISIEGEKRMSCKFVKL